MSAWTAAPAPAEAWETQAKCREVGHPEDWTHDEPRTTETDAEREARHARQAKAQAVCETQCPVRSQCLEWALRTGQEYGILGGLTARQRRSRQEVCA